MVLGIVSTGENIQVEKYWPKDRTLGDTTFLQCRWSSQGKFAKCH